MYRPRAGRKPIADRLMNHVIALVDDDRNILTSVSIALQAEGFTTRVYSDGAAALKAILTKACLSATRLGGIP